MSPVKTWECRKADADFRINGRLDEQAWKDAKWLEPFGFIHNGESTPLETRIALLWNDEYLFAAYKVQDPDISGTMTDLTTIFIFRMKTLSCSLKAIDIITKLASIPSMPREGERIGRHADLNYQFLGLRHAVHIEGSVNCPEVEDKGWTVAIALPRKSLKHIAGGRVLPPRPGDSFRVTAYRAHHDRTNYKVKGWMWSIMGNDNIPIPECWNNVVFVD